MKIVKIILFSFMVVCSINPMYKVCKYSRQECERIRLDQRIEEGEVAILFQELQLLKTQLEIAKIRAILKRKSWSTEKTERVKRNLIKSETDINKSILLLSPKGCRHEKGTPDTIVY